MSRKIILFLFGITLFLSPYFAFANVEINEIMYDLKTGGDEGREWVEIFNNSDTPVDLSAFKFFEGDTNHRLKLSQGDIKVGAKSYAVIVSDGVKFKTDWPNFPGTILDSTFSLNNSGELVALKDADTISDQFSYQSSLGGAGNGKSLQKINGVWIEAIPTPGVENKIVFVPPPAPKSTIVEKPISEKVSTEQKISDEDIIKETVNEETIPVPDLPSEDKLYLFAIIFIIFLCVGSGAVYFIRRKKIDTNLGDDFEILEE